MFMRSKVLRRIMIYLLVAVVLWVLIVWFVQRSVLFPTRLIPAGLHVEPGPSVEVIWLNLPDGAGKVEAWFIPGDGVSAQRPGPAVMFAHGNGELIDLWQHDLRGYGDLGVSVLLVEYRGYGRSDGSPTQKGITEDLIAFYDRLVARPDVDPKRIVFHGRSLGGAAVAELSQHREPAAMILESTFTSVADMAWGFFVPRFLVRDRFDAVNALEDYQGPVLIVRGGQDEIVPPGHAERLRDAAAGPSTLIVYPDMGHNDPPPAGKYWDDVEAFLREAGIIG